MYKLIFEDDGNIKFTVETEKAYQLQKTIEKLEEYAAVLVRREDFYGRKEN